IILIIFFLCGGDLLSAQTDFSNEEPDQIKICYDKAFQNYCDKNYQKAIDYWNMILKLDPHQITAKNMIKEARAKLGKTSSSLKIKLFRLIKKGKYSQAKLTVEELLASDSSNPLYWEYQRRTKSVAAIIGRNYLKGKANNIAGKGILAYIIEKEDLDFAYDAFRYAHELYPKAKRFRLLIAMIEKEKPSLKLNATKPANIGIVEHKKNVALRQIYDSKYYLAIKILKSVLRLEPNDILTLKRLGSTYLQLKNYRQAERTWKKALKLSPNDTQLKKYLAALSQMKKKKK
ncbi:MAG: tetratricopeptide repeat protein, partial [Elusimicrobiales bacterium]|nr:tetratricopeptide repeat protein [Elusimicrobiales bacterium]